MDIVAKAKRAMRIVLKRKLDIRVDVRCAKRNRLGVYYAANKARARRRAEAQAEVNATDDAAIVVIALPCYCDPRSSCLLPCCC